MTIKSLPLLVLFSSSLLNAQVIPGRWEKVDSLPPGQQIIVTLKAGDRMECAFKGADSTKLTVTRGGSELAIPKADVATIMQQKPRSKKQSLIGAAVGAGAGAGGVAAFICSVDCIWDKDEVGIVILFSLIGAGAGAIVGYYTTDKPPDEVLYQAP